MTFWTDDRTQILKREAVRVPPLSGSEIATLIGDGCNKNMVVGKMHRLGYHLTDRVMGGTVEEKIARRYELARERARIWREANGARPRPTARKPSVAKLRPSRAGAGFVAIPIPLPREDYRPVGRLTIEQLNGNTCRFPTWPNTPGYLYCGDATIPGSPYCLACSQIAFNGIPQRKARSPWVVEKGGW